MRVSIDAVADPEPIVAAVDGVELVEDRNAELVITVGDKPLSAAAGRGEKRPLLPVGLDADWSPSVEVVTELLSSLVDRQLPTIDAAPLVVSAADNESIVAFDLTVVTSDPARISEYMIAVGGQPRATFRADGVVVATPLGSYGYARTAGGPQLDFGTGLAVVPIAPFATIADTWVLRPPISVSVERDDAVSVFADTTQLAAGRSELTVDIEAGRPLSLVDVRRLY